MSKYSPEAAAGRLRDLRRSYGYETAASFARAIGYDVARYQRTIDGCRPLLRFVAR